MAIENVKNPGGQGTATAAAAAPAKCSNSSHNGVLLSQESAQEVLNQLEALLPQVRAAAGREQSPRG
jgi:hypothetical protein